jgi:hypothetical protein
MMKVKTYEMKGSNRFVRTRTEAEENSKGKKQEKLCEKLEKRKKKIQIVSMLKSQQTQWYQ